MLLAGSFALPDERARFRAEAEAVARLHHANIVQIYEVGEYDVDAGLPRPFFTLEFVGGGNLAACVKGRPQPPGQAAAWVETLARATHYAHGQGIIHRDLKPSNVLLTEDGQPKICDFGVAKLVAASGVKTQSGMLVGTAEYMAPEQAAGDAAVGPAVDIYALGAILYTLLTGRPPFQGVSPLHTLEQVRRQEPITPGRLQPRIPRDLETICLKCLEKAPAKRYASALDLADDLRQFLCDEPIRGTAGHALGARRALDAPPQDAGVCPRGRGSQHDGGDRDFRRSRRFRKRHERFKALDAEAVAVTARTLAETERDRALRNLYVARTNLAGLALDAPAGLAQVAQLFSEWRGRDLRNDPRGWEWFYYQSLANRSERTLHGHIGDVGSLSWSPDGARLASGGLDGTIRIWDPATGKQILSFKARPGALGLAWSPDGKRLASADFPRKTVSIWDPNGRSLQMWTGHQADVWDVAWNPDNRRLASVDSAGTVIVWDVTEGRRLFDLKGKAVPRGCVCWSPDGQRVAAANSGTTVRIWDARGEKVLTTLAGHKATVTAVAWSPTGAKLATLGQDQTIVVWDATDGAELRRLPVLQPEDYPGAWPGVRTVGGWRLAVAI